MWRSGAPLETHPLAGNDVPLRHALTLTRARRQRPLHALRRQPGRARRRRGRPRPPASHGADRAGGMGPLPVRVLRPLPARRAGARPAPRPVDPPAGRSRHPRPCRAGDRRDRHRRRWRGARPGRTVAGVGPDRAAGRAGRPLPGRGAARHRGRAPPLAAGTATVASPPGRFPDHGPRGPHRALGHPERGRAVVRTRHAGRARAARRGGVGADRPGRPRGRRRGAGGGHRLQDGPVPP